MKKNLFLLLALMCMGSFVFAQRNATSAEIQAAKDALPSQYTNSNRQPVCPSGSTLFTDFTNALATGNAVITTGGDSDAAFTGTTSLTITGSDDGSGNPATAEVCFTVAADTDFSFDFLYTSTDIPGFDAFEVSIDGAPFLITDADGTGGTVNVALLAGQEFCFVVSTADGLFGGGNVDITNVQGEACNPPFVLVPTMSEWGLFLFGLGMVTLGLVFVYNKQRQLA